MGQPQQPPAGQPGTQQGTTQQVTAPPVQPAAPAQPVTLSMTQEQLDQIITGRLRAEREKHQRELEEERAKAGKTESEKLTIERDNALAEAKKARVDAGRQVATALAQAAAVAEGIKADRRAVAVSLAAVDSSVDNETGAVDEAKIKAALAKIAADYPEWKEAAPAATATTVTGQPGQQQTGTVPPASGGDAPTGTPTTPTLAEFEKMGYDERVALYNRDQAAYRRLQDELDKKQALGSGM